MRAMHQRAVFGSLLTDVVVSPRRATRPRTSRKSSRSSSGSGASSSSWTARAEAVMPARASQPFGLSSRSRRRRSLGSCTRFEPSPGDEPGDDARSRRLVQRRELASALLIQPGPSRHGDQNGVLRAGHVRHETTPGPRCGPAGLVAEGGREGSGGRRPRTRSPAPPCLGHVRPHPRRGSAAVPPASPIRPQPGLTQPVRPHLPEGVSSTTALPFSASPTLPKR